VAPPFLSLRAKMCVLSIFTPFCCLDFDHNFAASNLAQMSGDLIGHGLLNDTNMSWDSEQAVMNTQHRNLLAGQRQKAATNDRVSLNLL
jgi:hypothetical protein